MLAEISRNAVAAAGGTPFIALERPPWDAVAGDTWTRVADIEGAVAALAGPARRVFLAIGRQQVPAFSAQPQHHYLLRVVEEVKPPLPHTTVVVGRGPFDEAEDTVLLQAQGIDIVVSKNAGGRGAYAKIAAARALGLPVIMVERPALPPRPVAPDVAGVMDWLAHTGIDLGV